MPKLMIQINEPKIQGCHTYKYTSVVVLHNVKSIRIDLYSKNKDYERIEIKKKRKEKRFDLGFHTVEWSKNNVKIRKQ